MSAFSQNEEDRSENIKYPLVIENLRKSYPLQSGEVQNVVEVESFELNQGSQLAIQGVSGTGKSTFLNLIAGIVKPDFGVIRMGEIELSNLSEHARDRARAQLIGYVFQNFHLLQGCTALENVMVSMAINQNATRDRARELISHVGLSKKENFLPSQLSIGQQQRVGIARALANTPKLMLADEPTGNLDSENAKRSIDLLSSLCSSNHCTLLVVSHDEKIINRFEKSMHWQDINRAKGFDFEY
ncbi:MAG: ABC transporter ATP-binding protein [Verrucomicrobiota bacterium]|nr:ABC transporter ATP-binding protein [Verrucomicrobiota bacterium]